MTTPNNTVAGLPENARKECADELEAALNIERFGAPHSEARKAAIDAIASPAPSAGVAELTRWKAEVMPPGHSGWRMDEDAAGDWVLYADVVSALSQHPAAPSVPDLDAMVSRFLGWRLPDDFAPDNGISFTPISNPAWTHDTWPTGTNLLHAGQARAMFAYCIEGAAPSVSPAVAGDGLQAFKDYVHQRLDAMGVPVDPESPHKAAGCRIGGRLDYVEARIASSAPQGEIRLFDGQWVNIVNHANCWERYSKEDAIAEAVRMTEAKIAENVRDGRLPQPRPLQSPPHTPAAEQPQGEMVLVPREPTPKMRDAGMDASPMFGEGKRVGITTGEAAAIYAAMLSAAPSRPVVDGLQSGKWNFAGIDLAPDLLRLVGIKNAIGANPEGQAYFDNAASDMARKLLNQFQKQWGAKDQ